MQISNLVLTLMYVCVGNAIGWLYLFAESLKKEHQLNRTYAVLWMLFFIGNAFLIWDNYFIQHKAPISSMVIAGIVIYLCATGATGIKIFKINFKI